MKFCIQGLTRSILLLAFTTIAACGGGTEPIASPPTPFIMASVPAPAKKASTVTGGNGVVIHMYQALYGMAPSNALLVDYAFQANNDASTFVKNLTDRFASTSHADLTKLVLDNLGVTPTSVPAVNAKGESEYGLLLDAVKQIFTAFPTMRGQVILNMVNLLAGLETDVTYGAASIVYNSQASANFSYSSSSASDISTMVTLPPAPTLILSSSSATAYQGDTVTLTWSAMNATSCTASGGWSGTLATSGTQSVSVTALGANNYSLSCTNSTGKATTSASISSIVKPYFAQTPVLLPDVRSYYTNLCGNKTNAQSIASVDLNNDGRKDLLFTLWCETPIFGAYQPPSVKVPNAIVAFIQQPDGSFVDGTQKIFGTTFPEIGGVARSPLIGDLNGDGLPDIAYLVDHEDNRGIDPTTGDSSNLMATNAVLLSNINGTYSIIKYGGVAWAGTQALITNEQGGTDVYSFGPWKNPEVYRFLNNTPVDVTTSDWTVLGSAVAFRSSTNSTTDTAVTPDGMARLHLLSRASGAWLKISYWQLANFRWILNYPDKPQLGSAQVVTLDGQDYLNVYYGDSCFLKPTPNSVPQLMVAMNANKILGNYQGGGISSYASMMQPYFRIIPLSLVDGILKEGNVTISGQNTSISAFAMKCMDVNGDGYDDIVITTWGAGAKAAVYLNDMTGNLSAFDQTKFPTTNAIDIMSTMDFADVSGDGLNDYITRSLTGVTSTHTGAINYYYYRGLKPLY